MIPHALRIVLLVVMVSLEGKLSNGNNDLDPIGRFISDRSRMAPPTKEEATNSSNKWLKI